MYVLTYVLFCFVLFCPSTNATAHKQQSWEYSIIRGTDSWRAYHWASPWLPCSPVSHDKKGLWLPLPCEHWTLRWIWEMAPVTSGQTHRDNKKQRAGVSIEKYLCKLKAGEYTANNIGFIKTLVNSISTTYYVWELGHADFPAWALISSSTAETKQRLTDP